MSAIRTESNIYCKLCAFVIAARVTQEVRGLTCFSIYLQQFAWKETEKGHFCTSQFKAKSKRKRAGFTQSNKTSLYLLLSHI